MASRSFHTVCPNKDVEGMFIRNGFHYVNSIHSAEIVVFGGGADLNPQLYNQVKGHRFVNFDDKEDVRDVKAYNGLHIDQIKIGISRGAQFLNVMNGGQLLQHVSSHHSPHIIYDTLSGDQWIGSSKHHQMMVPDYTTGEVLAYASGVGENFHSPSGKPMSPIEVEPEIVWYESDKALCFQGHPESQNREDENRLFNLIGLLT